MQVLVDANAEEVEPFLGEQSMGTASPNSGNNFCVIFEHVTVTQDLPLRAVGTRGDEMKEDIVWVSGQPAALCLSTTDAHRREKYFKTTAGKKALGLMLRESLADLRGDAP